VKYIVEVLGERIPVEVDGDALVVDGQGVAASLSGADGTPERLLRVGAAVHRVQLLRGEGAGRWVVEVAGHRLAVEALDERTRAIRELTRTTGAASGPAPLVAPMPGLVVRVLVAPGAVVAAGAPLLVMEAMKMENELRAPAAGVVRAVRAAPGTAVEKGAVLVELGTGTDEG
jgi:biotin carboxyl carrier protein